MSDGKRDLYKEAGVDVKKGEALADWLAENPGSASLPGEVVSGIGGFAALFRPDFSGMEDPLLISGTDGVGTKVLLGLESGQLEGLGIDLVAMCVNDLYTIGGRPLFFLDYYATGVLDENQFRQVLTGIKKGLEQSSALLLGGETAELPGLYAKGHFDLAGFVVGVVDGKKRLDPALVQPGDRLIALESSGFHSNGYSLVRRWLEEKPADTELLEKIMAPTRIYGAVPTLLERAGHGRVHALANITGGGISGNLPRVMPAGVVCEIDRSRLPTPVWMQTWIDSMGASFAETEGVFNMGAGMIAAVAEDAALAVLDLLGECGMPGVEIGFVRDGEPGAPCTVSYR